MNYLQRYTDWCNNQQPVTDAEIICFGNVKTLIEQSRSFERWWENLNATQKHDALDNIIRTTGRNLDVLFKPEARFSS
jgi:hypothetical protein